MLTYIIRRLLLLVPTLLGVTFLVFGVMAAAPGGIGGPTLTERGAQSTQGGASQERLREYYEMRYGLDKPWYAQYGRWLNSISPVGFGTYKPADPEVLAARQEADAQASGADGARTKPRIRAGDIRFSTFQFKWPDLGQSIARRRPVSDLLIDAMPITILLNLLSIPVVYSIGVITGVIAARHRGGATDVLIGSSQLALWSVPTIWAGVLLIGFLANNEYVNWFPTGGLSRVEALEMSFLPGYDSAGAFQRGYLLDRLWHLILPVACLSYGGFAFLSKLTRGSILENLNSDYARTARAKGLPERVVLYRHVFRNSTLALITIAASILPALLSGAVVVETIFGIPGMGKLGVDAVGLRDREVVLAVTLIGGLLGLTSMIVRDILYAMADPRVTYD